MAEQTIDKLQVEVEATAKGTSAVFRQLESQLSTLSRALSAIDTSKLDAVQKSVSKSKVGIDTSGISKAEKQVASGVAKIQQALAGLGAYANAAMGGDKSSLTSFDRRVTSIQSSIDTLQEKMKALGGTEVPTDAFLKLDAQIDSTSAKIKELEAEQDKMKKSGFDPATAQSAEWDSLSMKIAEAKDKIADLQEQQRQLTLSGEAISMPFEKFSAIIDELQGKLLEMSGQVHDAVKVEPEGLEETEKGAEKASASLRKMFDTGKLSESLKNGLHKIRDALSKIGDAAQKHASKGFMQLLKYGFGIRSLYVLFRRLRKAVVESFGELQNSGAFFETTRANIEALKASLTTLKFQFGAAFEPIFNAVAPALQALIDYLVTVMNVISAFMAKLTGKSTYSKAVANLGAYGSAAGGAAKAQKELNKQLQGFDELNNLTTNNGGGGGGGGGAGGSSPGATYVEESVDAVLGDFGKELAEKIRQGDWKGVGQAISDKLSEAMESIPWDKVYEKARNFGKGLANFLNGLINPRLFSNLGTTLANSINTAFEFLNSFGTTFDWTNFGTSIGTGITSFFQNADFKLWGSTVHTWIAGLLDAGIALVDNTDWALLGTKLGEFLENLDIPDLVKKLGTLAIKIIEGLGEALLNLAGSSTAGAIAASIAVVLGGLVFWNKLGTLVGNIGAALGIANWSGKIPSSCGANMLGEIGTQLDGGSLSLGTLTLLVGEFILVGNIASAILEKLYIDSGDEEGARYQEEYGTHPIKAAGEIISSIFDGSFTGGVKGLWNAFQNSDFITHLGDSFFAGWDFLFGGSAASAPEGKKLQGGYTPSILDAGGTSMLGAWNSFFGTGNTSSGFFKGIGKSLDTINKKFQTTGKTQDKFLETTQKGSKTSGKALKDNYDTGAIKPVGEAFSKVYDAVSKIWSKLGEDSKKYSYDFYTGFNSMPDETSARFALGYSQSTGKWSAFGDWVKGKANTINRGFDGTPTETSNKFGEAYNQSTNKWTNIGNWIKEKANIVNTGFNGFPSATATKFGEAYTQGTSKFNNTGSWIQGVYNTISQKISAVPGEFDAKFKSAADNATKQTKTFTDWFQNVNLTREASLSFSASGSNDFNIGSIVNSVNNVIHKFNESISLAIGKMNAANKGRMTLSFTAAKDIYVPYARGGVIDSATLALMGEAGTEAVVPLENNTKWLGKMADMMVGEMVKPQHLSIATSIASPYSGGGEASALSEQNALLREEVALLRQIAGKELTISSSEVFKATQAESNNYYNRTGNSPFLF